MKIYYKIFILIVFASTLCVALPKASLAPTFSLPFAVAPVATSYNAHYINHAVATPVLAAPAGPLIGAPPPPPPAVFPASIAHAHLAVPPAVLPAPGIAHAHLSAPPAFVSAPIGHSHAHLAAPPALLPAPFAHAHAHLPLGFKFK